MSYISIPVWINTTFPFLGAAQSNALFWSPQLCGSKAQKRDSFEGKMGLKGNGQGGKECHCLCPNSVWAGGLGLKLHLKIISFPGWAFPKLPLRGEEYENVPSVPGSPHHPALQRILSQRYERLPCPSLSHRRPLGSLHRWYSGTDHYSRRTVPPPHTNSVMSKPSLKRTLTVCLPFRLPNQPVRTSRWALQRRDDRRTHQHQDFRCHYELSGVRVSGSLRFQSAQ